MKKFRIVSQPTKRKDLDMDEIYDDIARDWESRARALLERRYRKLRQQYL